MQTPTLVADAMSIAVVGTQLGDDVIERILLCVTWLTWSLVVTQLIDTFLLDHVLKVLCYFNGVCQLVPENNNTVESIYSS